MLAGATLVAGLAVNLYLIVVARHLSADEYLYFSAFWSLALLVGFGIFLPVEQEVARLIPQRGSAGVLQLALVVAGVIALAEIAVVLAATPLLTNIFGHHSGTTLAIIALCAVSAVQFVARGAIIGRNALRTYASVVMLDGLTRVTLVLLVASLAASDSAQYAWTLPAAIGLVHVIALGRELRRSRREVPAEVVSQRPSWRAARLMLIALVPLLVGSLAAQALLNLPPIVAAALASDSEKVAAGQFQAAFNLVRIPLFVAVPLQTTLLPRINVMLRSGDPRARRRLVELMVGLVLVVGAIGVALSYAVGPRLVVLLFGPKYQVTAGSLAVLSVGAACYLGLLIATQALVASAWHKHVAAVWVAGIVVGAVFVAVLPNLVTAIEIGFMAGCVASFVIAVVSLSRRPPDQ